jgi:hypothetical protein
MRATTFIHLMRASEALTRLYKAGMCAPLWHSYIGGAGVSSSVQTE